MPHITRQERNKPVIVKDIVRFIFRYMLLEESVAEAMNCSNEAPIETIHERLSKPSGDPLLYPSLQRVGGPLGEGKCDDGVGNLPLCEELDNPLCNDFCFSRAGRGNDLHGAAPVLDGA
jgi:hypothetical protein